MRTTPDSGLRQNIRMTLEYDGSRYVGWQRQINGVSVQEKVEQALERQLGEKVRVTAAGRTDSGVHAMGQVINFHTESRLPARAIMRGALAYLPRDITIVAAQEVPDDFNARRSARMRWYRYFLCNRSVAPAVGSTYLTHVPYRLDLDKMHEATRTLCGHHDFKAFRAKTCTAKRTQLTMRKIALTPLPENILMLDYQCQSFLQNMVRILTGTIVACGRGKMSIAQLHEMLQGGCRKNEAVTLPPNGLFLYRVFYGEEFQAHETNS